MLVTYGYTPALDRMKSVLIIQRLERYIKDQIIEQAFRWLFGKEK